MFARHDLVWLSDQGWHRARDTAPENCRDTVEMWRQADWPAIVRRADTDLLPGQLSVGIATPPGPSDRCKQRIGFRVPQSDVKKVLPPLSLAEINDVTPHRWRPFLTALDKEAAGAGLTVCVYGSVALQAVTRQRYITAASDIDVLLRPIAREQLYRGLDLLDLYAGSLPLDGEIVFPYGQAVAWKELSETLRAKKGSRVLVKEMRGVYLATTNTLLATMKDDPCMI
jgi:phosphoribosyl-dephospho-CoA transferase